MAYASFCLCLCGEKPGFQAFQRQPARLNFAAPYFMPPAPLRPKKIAPSAPNVPTAPVRRAGPPNLLLDPHGISGTGTARRLRLSRHRRQLQSLTLLALILIGIAALIWLALRPRVTGFGVAQTRALPLNSASATLDETGALWVAARGGALWRVGENGVPARWGQSGALAFAPPLVTPDGGVYLAGLDGSMSAFGAPGAPRWKRQFDGSLATTPALWRDAMGAVLGVGDDDGRVFGLEAASGKTLWSAVALGPVGDAVVATREGFLVPTLSGSVARGGLICVAARSGQVLWRFPGADDLDAAGAASPLFDAAPNQVFWSNDEGAVYCLDASTGRKIWKSFAAPLRADSPFAVMLRAAPVLAGDNIIVGGNDGAVRALNARTGQAGWITSLDGPLATLSPVLANGKTAILAATATGQFALLDALSGAVLRRGAGAALWPTLDGKSAIALSESGEWQHLNW